MRLEETVPAEVLGWPDDYRSWWCQTRDYAIEQLGQGAADACDAATRDIRARLAEDLAAVLRARRAPTNSDGAGPQRFAPRSVVELVTDGKTLRAVDGRIADLAGVQDVGQLAEAARLLAPDLAGGRSELVVWIVGRPWRLPRALGDDRGGVAMLRHRFVAPAVARGERVETRGMPRAWATVRGQLSVHVAPAELVLPELGHDVDIALRVLGVLRELGLPPLLFSPPRMVHDLVIERQTRPLPAPVDDPVGEDYRVPAFTIPGCGWRRPVEPGGFARVFDRSGSYLAAWSGTVCAVGEWVHHVAPAALDDPVALGKLAGYWRIDLAPLRRALALGAAELPDLFARHNEDETPPGATWLTGPGAVHAAELAARFGVDLIATESYHAEARRVLDGAAHVLSDARLALMKARDEERDPAAVIALEIVKDGYTRGTAHFAYAAMYVSPTLRHYWRRAIVERHLANTYRALERTTPRPFAFGRIDSAVWRVENPAAIPKELRTGAALGAWHPIGAAVPMDEAVGALEASGMSGLVAHASGGPLDGSSSRRRE